MYSKLKGGCFSLILAYILYILSEPGEDRKMKRPKEELKFEMTLAG